MLEPDAGKLARPVLRGGGGGNVASLPGGSMCEGEVLGAPGNSSSRCESCPERALPCGIVPGMTGIVPCIAFVRLRAVRGSCCIHSAPFLTREQPGAVLLEHWERI